MIESGRDSLSAAPLHNSRDEPWTWARRDELTLRPRIGDKIRVWDSRGFHHYGVVIGLSMFGQPVVAHNSKERGVERVRLTEFAVGRTVEVESRVRGDWKVQQEVVRRALAYMGRGYDLLTFNCEHYASHVQTGRASSPQLEVLVLAALVVVGVVVLARE